MPATPEKTRTRGQGAKTPERRAAIARAALDVVQEKGHRALTTAEVAARAGISERAMLYHFPTRDHLLIAALDLADADDEIRFRGEHPEMVDVPDLETMAASFAEAATRNDRTIRLRAAMATAAADPDHPAHAFFRAHYRRGREGLATMIRALQERGIAHPDLDPDEVGLHLLAQWQGLEGLWLVDPDFDLVAGMTQAFRRLTGQPLMEQRALLDQLVSTI